MSTIVFAGPSLPPECRAGGYEWRPPATAGDLLVLLANPPDTVCLIDGYFDGRPAPWHKEILLLLQAGIRVIGAASIGALRAAELDRFGMEGIGTIYRAYRKGLLTGDDEVALVHAPEALGCRPLSEPMVEVRATLAAAVRAGRMPLARAREIRTIARSIHFSRREWPAILAASQAPDLDWLPGTAVRLKQQDALLCLAAASGSRPATRNQQITPITCFIDNLAKELGVAIPAPRVPLHPVPPAARATAP